MFPMKVEEKRSLISGKKICPISFMCCFRLLWEGVNKGIK